MEQLSSAIGSDVEDSVVPSSSSGNQSLAMTSTDATVSSPQGEQKCLQCHNLQQEIDSLKKRDEVYQNLKQKMVKTDVLIKKFVSKRQECEELQKKNEDLAHKYSLLMKNYKALENQLGNTVKELLPWKLDKERYVGEVTELRKKLEETEVNLSASQVLCKQLQEMVVSCEAQEGEYKCTITTLKGEIQQAVQKYKAESLKLKKATKQSLTLKQKSVEKDQTEGRLRKLLRKMQKIMLDKGLVPPEIPDNVCDQGGVVEGDDSDIELMDESEDEEPTEKAEIISAKEEGKSTPSENVINIHDHADNQSVSGESNGVAEDSFSDFADEIDAQLGNVETSDKGTPDKVLAAESRTKQGEKTTANTPENITSVVKKLGIVSPAKTELSCDKKEGSLPVLKNNRKRSVSSGSGDDRKNVKPEHKQKESTVVSMVTSPILNRLGNSECLSDENDDNTDEEKFGKMSERLAAGCKEMVGKDRVKGRRGRSKRRNQEKSAEEGGSDDKGEVSARQDESSSKSSCKTLLLRRADVVSSSLSDSSSDEEDKKEKEARGEEEVGRVEEKRSIKDEPDKMGAGEELNHSRTDDTMDNKIMDENTEIIKLPNVSKEITSSQEEKKLGVDLKMEEIGAEENLQEGEDKSSKSFANDIEIPQDRKTKEQFGKISCSRESGENVSENTNVDEKEENADKGSEDERQQAKESDAILLHSPRRVTRGMLKSLQDTRVLKDTNGNHVEQGDGDDEVKSRNVNTKESTSSRLKNLVSDMQSIYERSENVIEEKSELDGQNEDDKKSFSHEEVKEGDSLGASLFDVEDVGNENIDDEGDGKTEKRIAEDDHKKQGVKRTGGIEKHLMTRIDDDPDVTVKIDRGVLEHQGQKHGEIYGEEVLADQAKSSEEIDWLEMEDTSAVDGREIDGGQRMTRSKMKSVHVKEEFSGKRVTRLKAKTMPEVAEYLREVSGKDVKQGGTRKNANKAKNAPKSVEFLSTSESEDDGAVGNKGKWGRSPSRRNLKQRINENEKGNKIVFSGVDEEGENRRKVDDDTVRVKEVGTGPPVHDKKTKEVEDVENEVESNDNVSGASKSIQDQLGDPHVKAKKNVSFLERQECVESEEVSGQGIFVKKEVFSCDDSKRSSNIDVDYNRQSSEWKGSTDRTERNAQFGMGIMDKVKTEPDDKEINVSHNARTSAEKRKQSSKGKKSKRKRSDVNSSSSRRVVFESDGEEGEGQGMEKSAAASPEVKSKHPQKSDSSQVGTFKDVIHEAEKYRSCSELSDSLSSPKSAGFSPCRETPFEFEKLKELLQTSKQIGGEGKISGDLNVMDKETRENTGDGLGKGEGAVDMGKSEEERKMDNRGLSNHSLQEIKGFSQNQRGEVSHEQRNFQTIRDDCDHFNQRSDSKDRSENFPSELPFENLMNLDRVSPIPISPLEAADEPLLEPMISSILDSLPLIVRMLSPIPASPSRDDDLLGNREDDGEQQRTLSPLSPSDPVSFLPPLSTTDTSRPLSPLPQTPVPLEDTPEGEPSVASPMNFHAVVPDGVITVKPQMGTSMNSERRSAHSNTSNTNEIVVPSPDHLADTGEKDDANFIEQEEHNSTSQKCQVERTSGFKDTHNDSSSGEGTKKKETREASKEECSQTKMGVDMMVEGIAEGKGKGIDKLKGDEQMDENSICQDDRNKDSKEDDVHLKMETGSEGGQVKELNKDEVCSGDDFNADSLRIKSLLSSDSQIEGSKVNEKGGMQPEKEKVNDEIRDGEIARKLDEKILGDKSKEVRYLRGKEAAPVIVPDEGSTKEDGSSLHVSDEDRRGILQSLSHKQGFSKEIHKEDKKARNNWNVSGKDQTQKDENATKEMKSEEGSSSGLKRGGSLGFTCDKNIAGSESPSDDSTTLSKESLQKGEKIESNQTGNKEKMKFGGSTASKMDENKQSGKEKGNLANEQKAKGDEINDNAKASPTKAGQDTQEDDLADFTEYNINARERLKADSSLAQSSKKTVGQIWGDIAANEEDTCKRKNWREHAKSKKQRIGKGIRLIKDSEAFSNEEVVLDELLEEIHEKTEDIHQTVQRIVTFVKQNSMDLFETVKSKVQRKDSSLDAVITSDEEKLIAAISQRDEDEDEEQIVPPLLRWFSMQILQEKRKNDPRDHSRRIAYCRMLAAFCRLEGNVMQLRVLCYDLVKKKIGRWEELLVCIASVWSAALTRRENQMTQPMISVLEFLTWQKLKSHDKKQKLSDELWQALEFMCHWKEPFAKEDDKLIQSFIEQVKDCELMKFANQLTTTSPLEHPAFEIVKAIELLAWFKGWQWTWTVVIRTHIWPALGGLCKEVSQGQTQKASCICCCLKVLGNLGAIGLKDEQNQNVFDLMKMIAEILKQSTETIPPIVQVYAVQTILNLAPIQPFYAHECLEKWTNDHEDIQLIKHEKGRKGALARFVKSFQQPETGRTQGKQMNYQRMPPPQNFSSQKRGGPSRGGPSRGGPSRGGPSRGGPSRGGSSRGGPSGGGQSRGGYHKGGRRPHFGK